MSSPIVHQKTHVFSYGFRACSVEVNLRIGEHGGFWNLNHRMKPFQPLRRSGRYSFLKGVLSRRWVHLKDTSGSKIHRPVVVV